MCVFVCVCIYSSLRFSQWFQLQRLQPSNFLPHLKALSELSIGMAVIVAGATVAYGWARGAPLAALIFCQPLLILYLVYWRGSRFEVALDSVIKFFFTGFAIARPLFMLFERLAKALPFTAPIEAVPFLYLISALLAEALKVRARKPQNDELRRRFYTPSKLAPHDTVLRRRLHRHPIPLPQGHLYGPRCPQEGVRRILHSPRLRLRRF